MNIDREAYDRIHRKIVAKLRRLGDSEEEARAISRETFLRAVRSSKTFRGDSELDTWIVGIAKKVRLQRIRDSRRDKRRGEHVSFEPELEVRTAPGWPGGSAAPSPERQAQMREDLAFAQREIEALPPEQRRALTLAVEGSTYEEIGEEMHESVRRVSSLVHQARQKLRRKLSERRADGAS